MCGGKTKRTHFRYDYSLPLLVRLITGLVAIVLAIVTVACALGVTAKWQRGDAGTDLFDVVVLSAVASLCVAAVIVWLWAWTQRNSWGLGVDDGTLYWSSNGKEKLIPCVNVASIRIRSFGEWPDMKIVMTDGARESVPSMCLGNLDKFCEAIHSSAPQASVDFNGFGICDVCGKPTRTKYVSRHSESFAGTRCFCKVHHPTTSQNE